MEGREEEEEDGTEIQPMGRGRASSFSQRAADAIRRNPFLIFVFANSLVSGTDARKDPGRTKCQRVCGVRTTELFWCADAPIQIHPTS